MNNNLIHYLSVLTQRASRLIYTESDEFKLPLGGNPIEQKRACFIFYKFVC